MFVKVADGAAAVYVVVGAIGVDVNVNMGDAVGVAEGSAVKDGVGVLEGLAFIVNSK